MPSGIGLTNAWIVPVMAGIIIGLLCAAMRILWGRLDAAVDKIYANSAELAVLREKIKCVENSKKDKD